MCLVSEFLGLYLVLATELDSLSLTLDEYSENRFSHHLIWTTILWKQIFSESGSRAIRAKKLT